MNKFEKTLEWLFAQLPMYQRIGKAAYKSNLDITIMLDEYFGYPHKKFKTIHVAGTNGKGSVSHMLAAILSKAGYKTGLYTSPHLLDFRERIRIDGQMIDKRDVVTWLEKHKSIFEEMQPSFFEMTVALAYDYFAKEAVDIAVVEVGMGGRLDSTNIITPEVSIITNIGKDHTEFLGNTLVEIAREKAGIIKYGIPVVIGERRPEVIEVLQSRANELEATLFDANQFYQVPCSVRTPDGRHHFQVKRGKRSVFPELSSDLSGIVQRKNLPVVLEAIEVLKLNKWTVPISAIYEGISSVKEVTGLNGRWDIVETDPLLVYDTAHNEDGIRSVLHQLEETKFDKLHVVIGAVNDKAIDKILQMLPDEGFYYFTRADIPRALDAKVLAAKAGFYGLNGKITEDVKEALALARKEAANDDLILVTGSTYVVAEAY
ncbi:MAG: bifunctional folylpolyglutamate synthase/dihydrofolate synthase [Bacteroidales bacterium]|nr:bifunctional folylpolyglutamate synthase/dihydrofolate synthase [Bacteroidales bacterium]